MPGRFDKLGIHFQYPDNWQLDESEALSGDQAVSVYAPGGAFWSIMIHPADADPPELALAAVQAMREQYDDLDAEPVSEEVAGTQLVGYDMNFYCLDLTNTAQVRAYRTENGVYVVFCQSDDTEFAEVELVFRAMTLSLFR